MVGAHGGRNSSPRGGQEAKREEEEGLGSSNSLLGHSSSDPTSSHQSLPLKGYTTSQPFNTWAFGDISDPIYCRDSILLWSHVGEDAHGESVKPRFPWAPFWNQISWPTMSFLSLPLSPEPGLHESFPFPSLCTARSFLSTNSPVMPRRPFFLPGLPLPSFPPLTNTERCCSNCTFLKPSVSPLGFGGHVNHSYEILLYRNAGGTFKSVRGKSENELLTYSVF